MAEGPGLYPRDLLRRLGRSGESPMVVEEPVEVELSLGLSLGGDYDKGLVRSSSISAISNFVDAKGEEKGLVRTCSLPAGSGEQIRKRKDLQCLRRMEAKRKRCEKRCLRLEQLKGGDNGIAGLVPSRSEVWMNCVGGGQGGCSTTSSDYDCRPMEGLDISGLRRSNSDAAKINSSIKLTEKPTEDSISCALEKDASDPLNLASKGLSEVASSMIAEMPSVSAKGDGPNGRKIEGFLYKYSKCEDVRIVCVCHGSFLSPAEFVKHAGGSDVEFPLRHIVVHPCP